MSRLAPAELTLIKDMVDELVVNKGILDLRNLKVSIHNINFQRLAVIACQYYRMIIESKLSFDFSEVEKYGYPAVAGQTESGPICKACGSPSEITITRESCFVPLCLSCHQKLDTNIAICSTLMRE
jgi:hypothetical protein